MQSFVSFWASMFQIVQDFLLSEPIIWFIGLFMLFIIVGFLQKVFNISK